MNDSVIKNEREINIEKELEELSSELPKFPDGRIDYSHSYKAVVLTCFIEFEDKILLLKRSEEVGTDKGLWSTVQGYIDTLGPIEAKVYGELKEELNIDTNIVQNIKIGKIYEFVDNKIWIIVPVIAQLKTMPVINIDWEHTEYKWINPSELKQYKIAADLDNTLSYALR